MEERRAMMDATSCAWMVRSMPDRVSCIHIIDGSIIAGDWSGGLACWSLEGETLWEFSGPDRVSSIDVDSEHVVVSMGVDILLLSLEDGIELWRKELEGSADEAVILENSGVHAISSVFDIEHGDFMESAYWHYSTDGELQSVFKFDERPWFFDVNNERALMGLGRPRCGILVVEDGELEWQELIDDDPVSCGIRVGNEIIIGHSKGGLSTIDSKGESKSLDLEIGIEEIVAKPSGLVVSSESKLHHLSNDESLSPWSEAINVREFTTSFSPIGEVAAVWGIIGTTLSAFAETGERAATLSFSSPPCSVSGDGGLLVVGTEKGDLYVFQRELLCRRVASSESQEINTVDSQRSSLMEKLRKLRK